MYELYLKLQDVRVVIDLIMKLPSTPDATVLTKPSADVLLDRLMGEANALFSELRTKRADADNKRGYGD